MYSSLNPSILSSPRHVNTSYIIIIIYTRVRYPEQYLWQNKADRKHLKLGVIAQDVKNKLDGHNNEDVGRKTTTVEKYCKMNGHIIIQLGTEDYEN